MAFGDPSGKADVGSGAIELLGDRRIGGQSLQAFDALLGDRHVRKGWGVRGYEDEEYLSQQPQQKGDPLKRIYLLL